MAGGLEPFHDLARRSEIEPARLVGNQQRVPQRVRDADLFEGQARVTAEIGLDLADERTAFLELVLQACEFRWGRFRDLLEDRRDRRLGLLRLRHEAVGEAFDTLSGRLATDQGGDDQGERITANPHLFASLGAEP